MTSSAFEDKTHSYRLVIDEQFDGDTLDPARWIPHYLPHWAGSERSRARYRVADGQLALFITGDQPVWLPDVEPALRVSSLQTGTHSGPVGSTIGQHRTDERLRVVEALPTERLITPRFGAIEMRARWNPHPNGMVALWMIGFEDDPTRSAEICVCEIFGSEADARSALIGTGVHPFGDPAIVDDFEKIPTDIDVSQFHIYGAIWTPNDVTFYIDGEPTKHVQQSPQYPMQLMLNTWEFADGADRTPIDPFVVDWIRIHQL